MDEILSTESQLLYIHVPVSALVYLLVMDHMMPMSKRSPFHILTCVLEIVHVYIPYLI